MILLIISFFLKLNIKYYNLIIILNLSLLFLIINVIFKYNLNLILILLYYQMSYF